MTMPSSQMPLVLSKLLLWLMLVTASGILLARRRVTRRLRLAFVVGGVILFGLVYGLLMRAGDNPNPVASLRQLLAAVFGQGKLAAPIVGIMLALLLASWISNKSICGWACQLGLLQDLLHRVPVTKWKPPFWLSNGVRVVAFVALIGGLVLAGLDWIGVVDPFRLFQFDLTGAGLIVTGLVLLASLFIYRPWCQFLCPYGLVSWIVEQVSVLRPRINREACVGCKACVRACPSQAMAAIYENKAIRPDCFACGACIAACPREDALGWRKKAS